MSRFRIHYPSGRTLEVVGTLRAVDLGGDLGVSTMIHLDRKRAAVLDPRAVVLQDGAVVVDPRQLEERLAPWARLWLAAHPEWPRVITEVCA